MDELAIMTQTLKTVLWCLASGQQMWRIIKLSLFYHYLHSASNWFIHCSNMIDIVKQLLFIIQSQTQAIDTKFDVRSITWKIVTSQSRASYSIIIIKYYLKIISIIQASISIWNFTKYWKKIISKQRFIRSLCQKLTFISIRAIIISCEMHSE